MMPIVFHPDKRYLIKLYIGTLFVLSIPGIWLGIAGIGLIANVVDLTIDVVVGTMLVAGAVFVIFLYITIYYRSIRYEIHEDEVIVYAGVLTRTVKHVPFRTVTNLQVTRGLMDQILGLGSFSIETAGSSGTTRPEEKLIGLTDVDGVYGYVADQLRRFRGGMSPTQAGEEAIASPTRASDQQVLLAILRELRAIRAGIEQS